MTLIQRFAAVRACVLHAARRAVQNRLFALPTTVFCWLLLFVPSCIERPLGTDPPRVTNVIVGELRQTAVDKIDMLFVIDNSLSMADKQEILALAVPDLMKRLVDPVCVDATDASQTVQPQGGDCPPGFVREFEPIDDIHVGVITSSLGGFGAIGDCDDVTLGKADYAHLLGSLPRGGGVQPGFLSWCTPDAASRGRCSSNAESAGIQTFSDAFQNQVALAGDTGCGWEATLESWYRFLVEPNPWTEVVRVDCSFGGDMDASCVAPATDATGAILVDQTLLAQRKAFMRPDSLLAIVMLTDENDCSFKATGQSWRLSQSEELRSDGRMGTNRAYKGTSACAVTPNDPCCHSCGVATPPPQCPTTTDDKGRVVGAGCEQREYAAEEDLRDSSEVTDDPINLRCFNQKQRFGVDYLYPTARYTNALTLKELCPFAETLSPDATDSAGNRICRDDQIVPNPLYSDITFEDRLLIDPAATQILSRSDDLVFLAGIVGVPWQDLAVDPNADVLVYRTNGDDATTPTEARIDWNFLLGSDVKGSAYSLLEHPPGDPLMHEQIDARENTRAEINGGEWNILERNDLQYACTFPLATPKTCLAAVEGTSDCDCTYYGDEAYQNPLCEGLEQVAAKAYPSIRPLQVLRDYGPNSIVASICPKNTSSSEAQDFGYRPAVTAIVDRLKEQLKDKCLPRKLEVKEDGTVSCLIVEADTDGNGTCDTSRARDVVADSVAKQVRKRLKASRICTTDEECNAFTLCHIKPLEPQSAQYAECLATETPSGDGWCYIDPAQGLGEMSQVAKCDDTKQRKIRFAGAGKPNKGTITFFACAGARERVGADPAEATLVDETL